VDDGYVGWRKFDAKQTGIQIAFPEVDWNKHVRFLSRMEVLEFQGWAMGDIFVNVPGQYAVHCQGITAFSVDDVMVVGDVFGTGQVKAVLTLRPGIHTLAVRVRGKASTSFQCSITSAFDAGTLSSSILEVHPPRLAPDLVEIGDRLVQFSEFFAIPVLNWGPHTLRNISFDVGTSQTGSNSVCAVHTVAFGSR
jgi:hypothetical protein